MSRMTAPSQDTSSRQAGTAHGAVLLAAAVMPIMAITCLIPVLPALMREFADVPGHAVLVPIALTIPALCVALFSPFAGWLSDHMGRKSLLVGALAAYGIVDFLPVILAMAAIIAIAAVGSGLIAYRARSVGTPQ